MPGHPTKRRNIWTPLLFFFLLIIGIFIGFQLNKYFFHKRPITTVIERNDRLEEIIDLINQRYVDSVYKDSLYVDAIRGILKHLDPHTTYIPAREMREVNNELKGNFQGIGIEFLILKDTFMVSAVLNNSPALEAGLKTGDQILKVDSSLVAGNHTTAEAIKKLLRGKGDSKVTLTLLRYGSELPFPVSVKRGLVPLYSVDAAYMIAPGTGYIKINRFSATTYREFMKSIRPLVKSGMNSFILDLRQNPGGYLDAATAIADEFINKDKLLVSARGRALPEETFKADKKGIFEKGKLIILADEGSASASEILAGAIQDWDRGLIIGRRTFGKGLVQEQYELTDGSALRLTIARYYTPSGRNIQKPYDQEREAYLQGFENGINIIGTDTFFPQRKTKYYTKENHRIVYGGGGIKPDITIPMEKDFYSRSLYILLTSNILEQTVYQYYVSHQEQFLPYHTFADFDKKFVFNTDLRNLLENNYALKFPKQTAEVWADKKAVNFLSLRMKSLFARILFGNNGYYHSLNEQDTVVQKALQVLQTKGAYSKIIHGEGI